MLALRRRLARDLGRVRGDLLPLDGPLQHPLEDRHRLSDRFGPDALALELGPEAADHRRRQLAQPVAAEIG